MAQTVPTHRLPLLHLATSLVLVMSAMLGGCDCRGGPDRCESSDDCLDDGLFCTIPECVFSRGAVRGVCMYTASPCATGERCDEDARMCEPCLGGFCDPDAGVAAMCEERVSGTSCVSARSCSADSTCQPEGLLSEWGSTRIDGSTGRSLAMRIFPDGYCAVGCDASRLNDECGECASCSGDTLAGASRLPLYFASTDYEAGAGVCRESCTPSRTGTGCARAGYTCDLETSTCMEACIDDTQCQVVYGDSNGDGRNELIDRGADFPGYCDAVTGRCRTHGRPGASVGDRCTRDDDCEDDGACLLAPGGLDGICTRRGCLASGFECEAGTACDVRNVGWASSGCMLSCRVGAEDGTTAVRGARSGGNPDCGLGLSCVWNGVAERGDEMAGSCVVGAYTDVATPNVGAPCDSVAECDSPFGYGVCLFGGEPLAPSGFCTVQSCGSFEVDDTVANGLLPGVEIDSPICDPARNELCINVASQRDAPRPYCLVTCDDASECAPGFACTQLLSNPTTFCWPFCFGPGECHDGAICAGPDGVECTGLEGYCTCSDGGAG